MAPGPEAEGARSLRGLRSPREMPRGGGREEGLLGSSAVLGPGQMRARRHKFLLLLTVQVVFSGLLGLGAADLARALYPGADLFSVRLLFPPLVLLVSYFLLAWRNLYSRDYHYYFRRGHTPLVRTSIIPVALGCAVSLLLGAEWHFPPLLPVLFLAAVFLSFPAADGFQQLWIRYLCRLGYFQRNILVVGRPGPASPGDARARDVGFTKIYVGEIDRSDGVLLWKPARGGAPSVLRDFSQVTSVILKENVGDVLIFSGDENDGSFERELVAFCQSLAISYYRVPPHPTAKENRIATLFFPDLPVSERFAGSRDSLTAVSVKRLLDLVVSLACLLLFLPAGLVIALAILIDDGRPIFYVSTRIGKNGRPMRFLKFRTMVRDAEQAREKLLAFNARSDGPLFKMRNDPRVTRVGLLLRRYGLDEFPQLLNVLAGSLSLTGPRPHLPREVAAYREGDYLRLECMPGIVGLPQVSGRSSTIGFREWVDLDLSYRRHWSLAVDAGIMLKTARQFLRGLFSPPSGEHY